MQPLPGRMPLLIKTDARRTMQLTHHHTLGTVDDKRGAIRHQRELAQINLAFLNLLVVAHQAQRQVQRRTVRGAVSDAIAIIARHIAPSVGNILQAILVIVILNRKKVLEDRLQTDLFAFRRRNKLLQKLLVGIQLQTQQIQRRNDFF